MQERSGAGQFTRDQTLPLPIEFERIGVAEDVTEAAEVVEQAVQFFVNHGGVVAGDRKAASFSKGPRASL